MAYAGSTFDDPAPPPMPTGVDGGGGGRRARGGAPGAPAGPGAQAPPSACPPGQQIINGQCRHPGDFPCPPGQCKDKVSGACRSPGGNEKINETDIQERSTGGGRGYCKQREAGAGGRGGGPGLAAEQAYFDRLVAQGDWTESPPGSGNYYNDPGNDPSRRVWVRRDSLQLDASGKGYVSSSSPGGPPGSGGNGPGGPGGGFPGGPGDASGTIWQALLARLNGGSRYTPGVVSGLMGQAKLTAEAGGEQQRQAALEDAATRGIARSSVINPAFREIRAGVSSQLLQTQNQIQKAKIDADFQDKTETLNQMLEWLNSLRQHQASMASTSAQRDVGMANITLGYARLQQEMQMMQEQYQQQLSMVMLGGGGGF
jgi:hypothetical protein